MTQEQLKALLSDMSLHEKVLQMIQIEGGYFGGTVTTSPEKRYALNETDQYSIGSVLSICGAKKLRAIQDRFLATQPHRIPALFMGDVIYGFRTEYPVPLAQGCTFHPELTEKISEIAAREASSAGLHVTFAPMCDLSRDARWGRCMESNGEDPWLNAQFAAASVRGFQGKHPKAKGRIAACVKHFAAYGAAIAGRDYNEVDISERAFYQDYLTAYQAAIDAGALVVMSAFNTFDRIPCTVNRHLLNDVLRRKLGFRGVVISDAAAVWETIPHGVSADYADAAVKAVSAGVDVEMTSGCYIRGLEAAVQDGRLSEKVIDAAVMRILTLKNKLGLFENPYKDADEVQEATVCLCRENLDFSRRVAEESIVLLKNEGILPLTHKEKIAVIGDLANRRDIKGSWGIFEQGDSVITLREALEQLYPECDMTFSTSDDCDDAVRAAKDADKVILTVGEYECESGEARSKADIVLSEKHMKLFRAVRSENTHIVTVVISGRPLALTEVSEQSEGLIAMFYAGTCGTLALSDILYGKVNPSGKLSMSMPRCTGQLPLSYNALPTGRPKKRGTPGGSCNYNSAYTDCANEPLYQFGYGLSYTTYAYSPVSLDRREIRPGETVHASVTVTNTGSMAGMEAVQLYLRDPVASVSRPMLSLQGVQKIPLDAGESKTVTFDISEEMLRFYDIDMKYVSEPGQFRVFIAPDSRPENTDASPAGIAEFTLLGTDK